MLDGIFKKKLDRFWNRVAVVFVKLHFTPDLITILGLIFVIFGCVLFLIFKNPLLFGFILGVSLSTDFLDGAIARITNGATKFGGYLDAIIDRYQEISIYFTIGIVREYWLCSFLAITGSLMVSYTKARVAMVLPISNDNWPDLLERLERIILIISGLILEGLFPGKNILYYFVILIAILAYFTAIQRFFRAKNIIKREVK
jgi:CDP-diacylglycerol--glycerol-3-phosphate 3-phosphatidyltransferase/archaetidylinositol phosphate synthase